MKSDSECVLYPASHGLGYGSSEFSALEDQTVTPAQMLERPLRALVMDAQVRPRNWLVRCPGPGL